MPRDSLTLKSSTQTAMTRLSYDSKYSVLAPADARTRVRFSGGVILVVGTDLPPGIALGLDSVGFTVCLFRTAEDAARSADDRVPLAIVLAPRPGPDPYRVVRSLRAQERLAFVQVFMLVVDSAGFPPGDAIAEGVDDVFDVRDASHRQIEVQVTRIVARIARAQSLAKLAFIDPVTQLYNRRFLDERLPTEVARAARAGSKLSLAFVDLDDFKELNDTYGHVAGDRLLGAFGRALRSGLRSQDMTCRFGGDEFVVLFPNYDGAAARAALTKLLAERAWALADLPMVTFSAGVAQLPDEGSSWSTLFEVADRKARSAKNQRLRAPQA